MAYIFWRRKRNLVDVFENLYAFRCVCRPPWRRRSLEYYIPAFRLITIELQTSNNRNNTYKTLKQYQKKKVGTLLLAIEEEEILQDFVAFPPFE
jgi:hypothetical protein